MRKFIVSLILLVGICAAGTACQAEQEGVYVTPNNRPLKVAIQADSLIDMYDEQWAKGDLAQNNSLAMWSVAGSQYHHAGTWINSLTPAPDVFVIAQGLNSVADGWSAWDAASLNRTIAYARYWGKAPKVPCIVLVTPAHAPIANTTLAKNIQKVAFHYRNLAKANPNLFKVAEWRNHALYRNGYFVPDKIHLTETGSEAYERET